MQGTLEAGSTMLKHVGMHVIEVVILLIRGGQHFIVVAAIVAPFYVEKTKILIGLVRLMYGTDWNGLIIDK